MRFSITLKSSKGEFCINIKNGSDSLDVRNLYPTLTLMTTDEVKDDKRRWKPERNLSFSRFTGIRFVNAAKALLRKFIEKEDLFQYVDGVLHINQEVAKEVSQLSVAEFDARVLMLPVVGKDTQTGMRYEGIAVCIRDISNHIVLTYDEMRSLIEYIDRFDFDGMALKLLNVALSSIGANNLATGSVVSARNNENNNYTTGAVRNTIPELP